MNQPRLGDPAFFASDEVDAVLAKWRDDDPLHWVAELNCWALSRHADVLAVSRDPQTFRSGNGVLIGDMKREVSPAESILYMDPPTHARYRKLVSPAFTPRRIAALGDRVRELATELIDGIEDGQAVEFVDAIAAPLPLLVIAEMLGVPTSDRADFRRWSDAVMEAATEPTVESYKLAAELLGYFAERVAERRTDPGDDLLSLLTHAHVDGDQLTEAELLGFCMTLLVAGNETTRSVISGGAVALAEHPEQRDKLAADPSRAGGAVEEMLRWVTPVMAMGRTATRLVQMHDREIAEGDFVVLLYVAANRDEREFGPDADTFDIARTHNPHLAFGFGEHFCLGAALARMEARILFEEMLTRWPRFELVGRAERIPSTLLRQYAQVPLSFAASPERSIAVH